MAAVPIRRRQLSLKLDLPHPDASPAPTHPPHYTCSPPEDRLSDFDKLGVLGSGNGGTVYKVRHRATSKPFALKQLHPANPSDAALRSQVLQEVDILRRTSSPFVVRCSSIIPPSTSDGVDFAFVLEFEDAGTLDTLYRLHNCIPEKPLSEIARQALLGISYLHSNKIAHRDVKPSNFLVCSSGQIKVSDFGVSEVVTRGSNLCESYVGTAAYMSPERFDPSAHGPRHDGFAADVWGLGVTIMELYVGHYPLLPRGQRTDWASLMCAICFQEPPGVPETASQEFKSFVECCLQKEPRKRWTADELLCHPFVTRDREESRLAFMKLLVD